jgi:hypothetical protein
MRPALYSTVALLVAVSPVQAMAADVSDAGARQIVERMTYYLPKSIVDTGFLQVTPASRRYEMSIDLAPLLKDIPKDKFSISGLKPFIQYLTPQDDGLWKVESNGNLNVSGSFAAEGARSNFTYMIDRLATEGVIDPELGFTRSANISIGKLRFDTTTGPAAVNFLLDSYTSDMRAENIVGGVADVVSNMSGRGFSETITDPATGNVTISAASMDGRWQADKLGIAAFRDLVVFGLDKMKSGAGSLSKEDDARLKALIKANVPFVDNVVEDLHLRDVKVAAQGVQVSLADLGYKIEFNGIKADTRAGLEISITDPVVPPGLLPPGTEGALPKSASFGVAFVGLNVEGVVAYLIENADFTKASPLTPEQSEEIGRIILPDGRMHMEFANVSARSDVYDISLSGTIMVRPEDSSKPEADITVTMRDLDKTVKFLQENAAIVPQFGQASFGLLMMKGFAKQEADGDSVWNVKVGVNGKVMVNGREMPM